MESDLKRIDSLIQNGNYEDALRVVDALVIDQPSEASIWRTRAHVNSMSGDKQSAILDMDKAIQFCNIEPDYYFTRGILHFKTGNYKIAVDDFTHVIKLCDHHSSDYYREAGHFFRADAYVRLGQFSKALDDCAHIRNGTTAWTDRIRSKEQIMGDCL